MRGKTNLNPDHPRVFVKENCKALRHNLKNHYWVAKESGIAVPDPKFSDYCWSLRQILQTKSRKVKKNMERSDGKWGLYSYGGQKGFGPYSGVYFEDKELERYRSYRRAGVGSH